MRVYNRQFDETQKDYQKMWAFLVDDYADKQDHFIWTIGRLGEWPNSLSHLYGRFFPSLMRNNAQLWFNNIEELVGFVISENGNADFYVLARRGHEFLYHEMIEWVKANWGDRLGGFVTYADESQLALARALEKSGFHRGKISEVSRQYDLQSMDIQEPLLPEGVVVKDMFAYPNEIGSILVGENAWHNRNEVSDYDIVRYKFRRENPCYFPHLDIYAENGDGLVIANCNAFVDYKNNYAEIERVCTHNEHRKKGLASAVITECMRRLRDEGVKYAYISGSSEAAINLYGKFEFSACRNWHKFSLLFS